MSRAILPVMVLVGATAMTMPGYSAEPIELKSVATELPFGDMTFPPGPGVEAVERNCLFCHSAGMVLYQPALSKEVWAKEVDKMINVYKAPVRLEDIPTIVDYLTHIKGVK